MARVLIPVMPRRYNPNPRGSATTTVTMSGDNPFERPVNVLNSTRSMLPGMGALGMTDGPSADASLSPSQPMVPSASTGIDWSKILTGAVQAGAQLGVAKLQAQADRALPKTTGITNIPVQGYYPPPKHPALPWVIGGGAVLVLGLGAFLFFRK